MATPNVVNGRTRFTITFKASPRARKIRVGDRFHETLEDAQKAAAAMVAEEFREGVVISVVPAA